MTDYCNSACQRHRPAATTNQYTPGPRQTHTNTFKKTDQYMCAAQHVDMTAHSIQRYSGLHVHTLLWEDNIKYKNLHTQGGSEDICPMIQQHNTHLLMQTWITLVQGNAHVCQNHAEALTAKFEPNKLPLHQPEVYCLAVYVISVGDQRPSKSD